jgi:hypothetical protein
MVVGFENRMKKGKVLWFLHCQLIFSFEKSGYGTNWFYLKTGIPAMIAIFGIFSSVWTIILLLQKKNVDTNETLQKRLKSAYAVVVMNMGNVITSIIIILYQHYQAQMPVINFLGACGCFIVLSALNPMIRIYFSSEMRVTLSNLANDSLKQFHTSTNTT